MSVCLPFTALQFLESEKKSSAVEKQWKLRVERSNACQMCSQCGEMHVCVCVCACSWAGKCVSAAVK